MVSYADYRKAVIMMENGLSWKPRVTQTQPKSGAEYIQFKPDVEAYEQAIPVLFPHLSDEVRKQFTAPHLPARTKAQFYNNMFPANHIAIPTLRVKGSCTIVAHEVSESLVYPISRSISTAFSIKIAESDYPFAFEAIVYAEEHWPDQLIDSTWTHVEEYTVRTFAEPDSDGFQAPVDVSVYCAVLAGHVMFATTLQPEAMELRGSQRDFVYMRNAPLPRDAYGLLEKQGVFLRTTKRA